MWTPNSHFILWRQNEPKNTNQEWDVGISEKRYPTSHSTGCLCFKYRLVFCMNTAWVSFFHFYSKGGMSSYRCLRIYRKDDNWVKKATVTSPVVSRIVIETKQVFIKLELGYAQGTAEKRFHMCHGSFRANHFFYLGNLWIWSSISTT